MARSNRTRQYGDRTAEEEKGWAGGFAAPHSPDDTPEYRKRVAAGTIGNKKGGGGGQNRTTPSGRAGKNVLGVLAKTPGKSLGTPLAKTGPVTDPTAYNKTLADFLAMAREMMSSSTTSQGNDISAREAALKSNAADIQGRIGSGYQSLASRIAGQAAPIAQNFETGISQLGDISQQTSEAVTKANADAEAQRAALMNRLGIGDSNIMIQNTGTGNEGRVADTLTDVARDTQAAQTNLATNQNTEQNFNTNVASIAGLEGEGQQARISRDLLGRLAELQDQRTSIESQSEGSAVGLAQSLMDQDYRMWSDKYDRSYQTQRDAMSFAQEQAAMQAQANQQPEMNSTSYGALGPAGQAKYALSQFGVQNPDQIIDMITNEYGEGNFTDAKSFVQQIQSAARELGLPPVDTQNAALIYYNYFK